MAAPSLRRPLRGLRHEGARPRAAALQAGLELWSDGAAKQRWIAIPPGTKIDTSNIDEWVFPNGTKAWKEFRLDGKRIETRLYEKGASGTWRHATFVLERRRERRRAYAPAA